MEDEKKFRGPADKSRININESDEVEYWTKKFACSPGRLKAAVKTVGVMAKDVKAQLKKK
jgi:Protein of unknown function (DUF3606)